MFDSKNMSITLREAVSYAWNLEREKCLVSRIMITVRAAISSFFCSYSVSVSEIERLQESPEYNNTYVVKSLIKRGIKIIDVPSIDVLVNGKGMGLNTRMRESVDSLESQSQDFHEEIEVNEQENAELPIQPRNIYDARNIEMDVDIPDYIHLPNEVCNYSELESNELFSGIKSQFLSDINELNQLAKYFVQSQYHVRIKAFYRKLNVADEIFKEGFFKLYKETRFHIRCLLTKIKAYLSDDSSDATLKDYIAVVLHGCLEGIDLCSDGVYSRFRHAHIDLGASEKGMKEKVSSLKAKLLSQCIASFIVEREQQGLHISEEMEIHWFNTFYNLLCKSLDLPPYDDRFLQKSSHEKDFISLGELAVSRSAIIRELLHDWSGQMRAILQSEGALSWETEDINLSGDNLEIINALDNQLFQQLTSLLGAKGDEVLSITLLVDDRGNGDYSFERAPEKLFSWVARNFNMSKDNKKIESKSSVVTALPRTTFPFLYLGTSNDVFFWVFKSEAPLEEIQGCTFDTNNHITLNLSHLISMDFSRKSDEFIYAILTQALEKTSRVEDIVSFFLHPEISKQLGEKTHWIIKKLSTQLADKLLYGDSAFKKELYECLCSTLLSVNENCVSMETIAWLVETPLLEPLLFELNKKGIDVTSIMQSLTLQDISLFSTESLKMLLTTEDCRRLFMEACTFSRKEIALRLLLTETCDDLIDRLRTNGEPPLSFFASHNSFPGVKYLLERGLADVNDKNDDGVTVLMVAARRGNVESLKAVLNAGAGVNASCVSGEMTALHWAAKMGHVECVEVLLNEKGILVNLADKDSLMTPLHYAALNGNWRCLYQLLANKDIEVNPRGKTGMMPLHAAALNGHLECLKRLLQESDIIINELHALILTPLACCVLRGNILCLTELLAARGVKVNPDVGVNDYSTLHLAAQMGNLEILKLVLDSVDIQINVQNFEGITPLHLSIIFGFPACAKELLRNNNIWINVADNYGNTPLHCAANRGDIESLKALLDKGGIEVYLKNNDGDIPLDLAEKAGHAEFVDILRAKERNDKDKWLDLKPRLPS